MIFSARPTGVGAGPWWNDTTVLLPLGSVAETNDGRTFRWALAGASDLVAGNWIQAPAFIIAHSAMTPTATSVGATIVNVTPGATAGAANLYAEGFLTVSVSGSGAPLGYTYKVSGHAAITASVAFNVNLMASDPIQVALATSSRLDLTPNPYQQVIQFPATTATGKCVGVAPYIITAKQNGWLQTKGVGACLQKGTVAAGLGVGVPGSAAGACVAFAAATTGYVGDMMQTGVDAVGAAIYIRID